MENETAIFGNESEPYLSAVVFIQQPLTRSFPLGITYFAHTASFQYKKKVQLHAPTFLMRPRIANTDAGRWAQKQTKLEFDNYTTVAVVRCNGVTPRVAVSIPLAGITCFSFPCKLNVSLFWNHCHSTLFGVCPWVDFHSKSRLRRASMHNGGSVFTKNGTSIPRAKPTLSENV